jgi:exo-beta-1,3-glucanase (GH17 family)
MRWTSLFLAMVIAAITAFAGWWLADRPRPVTAEWDKPLASVSFAPFRRGESPLTRRYPTPAQVESDLKALAGRTEGIRTYTSREGLEVVPELAAKLGLKVTMGAWLGSDAGINDAEINALIAEANAHPDSIQRVIVGNEVLLRNDLSAEQLVAAIRKVKAAIKQPVSYADVWAFYLKNPQVAQEVDYVTIHILPFWEDEPMAVRGIEAHTMKVIDQIRAKFPGKPILIGEVGWPSIGRDRGPAVVDQANQASLVRQMANIAARQGFDYNIVEAFDQPWKSELENTVGAAWGILDEARQPKYPMTGPVPLVPDWQRRAMWAIALGALASLALGRRVDHPLAFGLAAQALSALLVTTIFHCLAVTFRPWQDYWLGLRIGLPALVYLASLIRLRDWLADPSLALQGAPAAFFGKAPVLARDPTRGQVWVVLSALYAIGWTVLLLADGRYRDIPEFDFSVPVAATLLLLGFRAVLARRQGGSLRAALSFDGLFPGRRSVATRLLAWLLPLSALAAMVSESAALLNGRDFTAAHPGLAEQLPYALAALIWNREMDLWAAMLLLWSLPFILSRHPVEAPAKGGRHQG